MLKTIGAAATHKGEVRANNEDAIWQDPEHSLWVVADGMGGHQRGDWASSRTVDALRLVRPDPDIDAACEQVADALIEANGAIFEAGASIGATFGSTVVVLHVHASRFACVWAGDSRAYVLSGGQLRQISTDHSQVQEMVAAQLITSDEARDHPMNNVITRAIGVRANLELDVVTGPVHDNDRFLLCSDGLVRCMSDDEISAMLGDGHPDAVVGRLIDTCLTRGAPDNVSVAVIACEQTTRVDLFPR